MKSDGRLSLARPFAAAVLVVLGLGCGSEADREREGSSAGSGGGATGGSGGQSAAHPDGSLGSGGVSPGPRGTGGAASAACGVFGDREDACTACAAARCGPQIARCFGENWATGDYWPGAACAEAAPCICSCDTAECRQGCRSLDAVCTQCHATVEQCLALVCGMECGSEQSPLLDGDFVGTLDAIETRTCLDTLQVGQQQYYSLRSDGPSSLRLCRVDEPEACMTLRRDGNRLSASREFQRMGCPVEELASGEVLSAQRFRLHRSQVDGGTCMCSTAFSQTFVGWARR